MKIRYAIIFALLLAVQPVAAQPYQSMFATGDGETRWLFIWNNLWGWGADTVLTENDTLVNNLSYKKLINKFFDTYIGLMREDVNTGRVWCWYDGDSIERLTFDFSMDVGDTFDISHFIESCNFDYNWNNYPDSFNVVDSVRYINGHKYIYFKGHYKSYMYISNGQYALNTEPFVFIDGIGSNAGVMWRQPVPNLMGGQYLLCSYKSGQKTWFNNRFYNGSCNFPSGIDDIKENSADIIIYPNPARNTDLLKIKGHEQENILSIQMVTVAGKQILSLQDGSNIRSISLYNIPAGYYWLKLYTKDQVIIKPMVIY